MEKIECPICRHSETGELFKIKDRLKISDQDFSIRKCSNCEIAFTAPALNKKEIEKFYPKTYLWKAEQKTKNKLIALLKKMEGKYADHILKYETKRLSKFVGKKGKILDVGCGNGLRLEAFRKEGFGQCYGIEPLKEDADFAKMKKLPVEQKTLDEFNCPENSFSVVTLYNVFEHLDDPVSHLKIIGNILEPQGWLIMQVPNFDSFQAKLFKKNWAPLDPPRHYFHYTPESIRNLLSQNGFKLKTIDWRANFLRPLFWGFSFSRSYPQLIWQKEEKGERTTFHRIWWMLLMLLSVIPTELENLLSKGGHMTIYAINQKQS